METIIKAMRTTPMEKELARAYSPVTLAFFGDAVYEILARHAVLQDGDRMIYKLHKAAVDKVRASFQSKAADVILPLLNEEEMNIFRRGRNAHGRVPRSSNPRDYRRATGLEAVFGYLALIGEYARLKQLFEVIYNVKTAQ